MPTPNVEPLSPGENLRLANFLIALNDPIVFRCEYTNWRGEKSCRRLTPVAFWHGSTEWHPEPGLNLRAIDRNKGQTRDFRVADFDMATLRAA